MKVNIFEPSKVLIYLVIVFLCQSSFAQKSTKNALHPKNKVNINSMNMKSIKVSSSAFQENQLIPFQYTCDGKNVNPPLEIRDLPEQAKCLALIVDDPDAPIGTWVHWVIWNIPVLKQIKENSIPGIEGTNDFQKQHYGGPCPPSGTHRYFFKVYALDVLLNLKKNTTKLDLEKAMNNHVLGYGELIGLYKSKR